MGANDDIAQATAANTVDILRISAGLRRPVIEVLESLEADLAGEVARKGKSLNSIARARALQKEAGALITDAYDRITIQQETGLKHLAVVQGEAAVTMVETAIGLPGLLNVELSAAVLEAIVQRPSIEGNSSRQWWSGQSISMRQAFQTQMQQGILRGESVPALVKRVTGTRENGYTDSILQKPKREATAIVRSSVISVSNEASMKSFEAMGEICQGIQWLSTLDGRTTIICMALSGKIWDLPDYKPRGHATPFPGPTAHWQCRSRQIPVLKSWDEITGRKFEVLDDQTLEERMKERLAAAGMDPAKVAKVKARVRASMDGQVPEDLTFDYWLSTKPDTWIDSTLGKGRARMYRDGNLSVSDLVDQNGRPLTVKQLEEKVRTGKALPETEGVLFNPGTPVNDLRKELANAKRTLARQSADAAADQAAIKAATGRKKKALKHVQKTDPNRPPGEQLAKAEGMLLDPSQWET